MLDFIIKYWIQWAFGIVALGLAGLAKHYHSLYKKDKTHDKEIELEKIHQDIEQQVEESEDKMMKHIEEVKNEALSSAVEKYNTVLDRLETHESDAMENYQSMFNSLSSQIQGLKKESDTQDYLIKEDLSNVHTGIDTLQSGILSIQGKEFKQTCRFLLDPSHIITEVEYEEIVEDHTTYNKLGGNHNGDCLFQMVEEKYRKQL